MIDSAEKRFSIMGMGAPQRKYMVPLGSVTKQHRLTMLDLYAGDPVIKFLQDVSDTFLKPILSKVLNCG